MSKVLITGITGLVGSAFVTLSVKTNSAIEFVAIARGRGTLTGTDRVKEAIKEQCEFDSCPDVYDRVLAQVEIIEGDLSDADVLETLEKRDDIDTIFHCAASVNLGKDLDGATYKNNFEGTKLLLNLAKKMGIKAFHYVSTAYVAGKHQGVSPEDGLIATDWFNSYEKSKFDAETLVRSFGIPFSIYRPSIVVGRLEDGDIRKPLAFYRILEFLGKLKRHYCSKAKLDPSETITMPLRLQAYPSETIFFTPIDFVQEALVKLFPQDVVNKTYHLTGNSPVTTKDIERTVKDTLKIEGVTVVNEITDPTKQEILIQRLLGDLLPYFSSAALFDTTNCREALGEEMCAWKMDDTHLHIMIGEYFKKHFPGICK